MTVKKTKTPPEKVEQKYLKTELIKSKRYADRRDYLQAMLRENTKYTFADVDQLIASYYGKAGK